MSAVTVSNLVLKWDNAPANYGAFFDGSEVLLRFKFAVGRYPLARVVRQSEGELITLLK